jgi:hypothetical protein
MGRLSACKYTKDKVFKTETHTPLKRMQFKPSTAYEDFHERIIGPNPDHERAGHQSIEGRRDLRHAHRAGEQSGAKGKIIDYRNHQ